MYIKDLKKVLDIFNDNDEVDVLSIININSVDENSMGYAIIDCEISEMKFSDDGLPQLIIRDKNKYMML